MTHSFNLTDEELGIVRQLLNGKRRELQSVVLRAIVPHDDVHGRLDLVRGLLEKLDGPGR
jgi:hypothetical protein